MKFHGGKPHSYRTQSRTKQAQMEAWVVVLESLEAERPMLYGVESRHTGERVDQMQTSHEEGMREYVNQLAKDDRYRSH